MKISDFPSSSKPRERFLDKGPEALSEAELLAIFLRVGTLGENVVDMSNRLIAKYGLAKLFECTLKELQMIRGIGQNKAMQILAMSELGKRHSKSKNPVFGITNAEDVYNYLKYDLRDKKQEEFWVLLLDTKNGIIKKEMIARGVLDAAIIHPREVFRPAIRNACSKIILVHNHPSGDPGPSGEDLDITKKIMNLGEEMDIRVLDHVIIGKERWWSWSEDGLD
jgi:DNA repair protein RadC